MCLKVNGQVESTINKSNKSPPDKKIAIICEKADFEEAIQLTGIVTSKRIDILKLN